MKNYLPDKDGFVMTRDEVRAFDAYAINTLGIPGAVLMENAGRSCAEFVMEKLADKPNPKVSIFCGTGNNGGDGFVIARHLLNRHFNVSVAICGDANKIKGDAKINLDILRSMKFQAESIQSGFDIGTPVKNISAGSDMLIDAVFGTGLSGRVSDEYKGLIGALNAMCIPILAVDIPSGLDCDTGEPLGAAVQAVYTVTFVAVKKGFTEAGAEKYTGEIYVASIGAEPK